MEEITLQEIEQHNISQLPEDVDIVYPENKLDPEADAAQNERLDLSYAGLEIDIADISNLKGEAFTLARRNGFGTSDSSVLLGVNPYKTVAELIKEKASPEISDKEKAIAQQVAVRKGNDLEPLIIEKFKQQFQAWICKPIDMYQAVQYPYLKFNFDGVSGKPNAYYPVEIKVVTTRGEKHYNPEKAMYIEGLGFLPLQTNVTDRNISIESKATHYGIPPYYYTQLQQEILGCGSQHGYLCVLFERTWTMYVFHIDRDEKVINAIKTEGYKAWEKVVALRKEKGYGERLGRI